MAAKRMHWRLARSSGAPLLVQRKMPIALAFSFTQVHAGGQRLAPGFAVVRYRKATTLEEALALLCSGSVRNPRAWCRLGVTCECFLVLHGNCASSASRSSQLMLMAIMCQADKDHAYYKSPINNATKLTRSVSTLTEEMWSSFDA